MALHNNRKGLDLPISGVPDAAVDRLKPPRQVALLGADFVGMKPTLHVREGDTVSRGQLLFDDKKTPGVRFTAPAEGTIAAIHRGDKRVFQSLVIELSSGELSGSTGRCTTFASYTGRSPESLTEDQVRELLLESGAWPALRARPYGGVADPGVRPHSIFVTAMDSNPLAPPMAVVLADRQAELRAGVLALTKLTDGLVFVCVGTDQELEIPEHERVRRERFSGPHPAGSVGWHIHRLDPVDGNKIVWHLGAQDLLGFGHLLRTGEPYVDRLVSLAGPGVLRPRLVHTRLGASIEELTAGQLRDGEQRVISGSPLSGRAVAGEVHGYLGRYDQQVSVLGEDRERKFLGWLTPGLDSYSITGAFLSKLLPGRRFALTTSTNGSDRVIMPTGVHEKVFPFDIPATYLLRALAMGDVERAEELGCRELLEEDVALCCFVDPGKNEFGVALRAILTTLQKEG